MDLDLIVTGSVSTGASLGAIAGCCSLLDSTAAAYNDAISDL